LYHRHGFPWRPYRGQTVTQHAPCDSVASPPIRWFDLGHGTLLTGPLPVSDVAPFLTPPSIRVFLGHPLGELPPLRRQGPLYTLPLTTQLLPPARGVWYARECCTRTRPLGGDHGQDEPHCERASAWW